jgi:DNA-binding winged helix-turn-helix (wHTH) protein
MVAGQCYEFGPFRLDGRVLFRDGRRVALTPKVLETLLVLVEADGRIVSKDELMQKLWPDTFVDETSLTSNISVLRKTLSTEGGGGFLCRNSSEARLSLRSSCSIDRQCCCP